jgi:hypothetical protein
MKNKRTRHHKLTTAATLACLATGIAAPMTAQAQNAAPAKPAAAAPSAGLLNDLLRAQSSAFDPWDIGGQIRLRGEVREYFAAPGVPGAVDFRATGGNSDNTFLMMREKIHIGYTPTPWASAFVEGRDTRVWNDDRRPRPDLDTFDLQQAYVTLGNAKEFPLTAKVGRQELSYGDERLIGSFDWTNVGRVFDAAKLRLEGSSGWVDGFVSRVVIPDDNNFNIANDYDWFSGVYASTKTIIPKQETQVYFLARNTGSGSPTTIGAGLPASLTGASPRDIYTIGLRVKSLPGAYGNWDYDAELAGQFGRYKTAVVATALDQEAFAAHIAGGYTWNDASIKPRLGLEYNYSSGDGNPTDGKHETFENLFPTNHKFYGYMDFFSWQNTHNARLAASIKPMKQLTITGDYHAFWLADTHDSFYQANGAPRSAGGYGINSAFSSYAGSEVDLVANYAIKPYAGLQAGYGHYFVGNYIESSLAASGSKDADWVYLQLTFNF